MCCWFLQERIIAVSSLLLFKNAFNQKTKSVNVCVCVCVCVCVTGTRHTHNQIDCVSRYPISTKHNGTRDYQQLDSIIQSTGQPSTILKYTKEYYPNSFVSLAGDARETKKIGKEGLKNTK
jgi:hypothetical protein